MRWDVNLILTAAWAFAGACIYLIVPESAPFLLPLAALAPMWWYPQPGLARNLWAPSLLARILAAAFIYLLINATWSTTPGLAYIGLATFFGGSIVVHIVTSTMPLLERAPVRAMAVGFYFAYVICAALLCVEVLLGHPLHLRTFEALPWLAPQISGMVVEGGIVKSLPSYFLNRHIAALMFLLWPALLVATTLVPSGRVRALLVLCLAPVIPAVFASDHETSKLAIAGAAVMFCLQTLAPRVGKTVVAAGWIFACVAVVPLTSVVYSNQLHKAKWLQPSAQHRIVIWGVTSSKIVEAPLFGHGMVAARELGRWDKEHPTYAADTPFIVSLGPHAHNVYLQVWFDTGVIGVLLMLGIGLFVLRAISHTVPANQPALYAAFASSALMAASSFSIWTRWFLASYMLCAIWALLASRFATDARSGRTADAADTEHDISNAAQSAPASRGA